MDPKISPRTEDLHWKRKPDNEHPVLKFRMNHRLVFLFAILTFSGFALTATWNPGFAEPPSNPTTVEDKNEQESGSRRKHTKQDSHTQVEPGRADATNQALPPLPSPMPLGNSGDDPELAAALEKLTPEQLAPPSEGSFLNERAFRAFREASEGKFSSGGTGNVILDDVLQVMRKSGPISSRLSSSQLPSDNQSGIPAKPESDGPGKQEKMRLSRTAEQLLKTARLLDQLSIQDPESVTLAKQMRAMAVRLLTP